MSRVEEIERAVAQLDQRRWDDQLDHDAAAGKLDFLREEGDVEQDGFPKNWP